MRRYLLSALVLVITITGFAQQKKKTEPVKQTSPSTTVTEGRNITITYTPYKNCWVYLGSYFGKSKTLADSAWLDDKSTGVFKGKDKLTGGIYFLVSPQYVLQFELLMDAAQHFNIVGDTLHRDAIKITGSADNDLFKEYSDVLAVKGKALNEINKELTSAKTAKDSAKLKDQFIKGNKDLQVYREAFIKQHPNSLLATLFAVMKIPDAPAVPVVNGKPDSLYPYRYVKNHYWDDVEFNDDRILHTPFFDKKLEDYYKYYVSPEADSIIKEVSYQLAYARTGKEMYPYLLMKFTNKYMNPEYMGQDKVFVYLFENYYSKGDTTYLDKASRKVVIERAYSLMANQLGEQAPILDLTDSSGKVTPMYALDGKFTVIAFWDPHCGHCKEQIPRLDSFYRKKWKALGVKVYAVNVEPGAVEDWKKFILERNLPADWAHTFQTKEAKDLDAANNRPNFRQLYGMTQTPTFFLLDGNKRIIAKQLGLDQLDQVIEVKLKNPTKENK